MFEGFHCDCVHDGHSAVVYERLGESSLGCLSGADVNFLSEPLGVNLRTCSSSNWFVGQLDGCSWRVLTYLRAVGDGFVCVSFCDIYGVWRRYYVHPWSWVREGLHELHPWRLCRGRRQMICWSISCLYYWFSFSFSGGLLGCTLGALFCWGYVGAFLVHCPNSSWRVLIARSYSSHIWIGASFSAHLSVCNPWRTQSSGGRVGCVR